MNTLFILYQFAFFTSLLMLLLSFKSKITIGKSNKVILLGFDGLGSHNLKRVNNLTNFQYLLDNGMWSLNAETDRAVKSGPNWVGILSGCNSEKSKIYDNQCVLPQCKTLLTNASAVYTEWDTIRCYSENIGFYKFSHRPNVTSIMNIINSKYRFVFLHLDELDAISHSYGSSHIFYMNKLKQLDEEVLGPIIKYIESKNATLIVTADHASDLHGYGHSGLPVPLILYGKGIYTGKIVKKTKNSDVFKYVNQLYM